jgi:YD repeat-containing protein
MRETARFGFLIVLLALISFLAASPTVAQSGVTYVYDDLGRLTAVIDPSGNAAGYSYDAVGNMLAITRYSSTQISVLNFTPQSGPIGTTVTISGTGFSATASLDTVKFNGTSATISSATANQIIVTVPTGATTGTIQVTSPAGSFTTSSSFTVTAGILVPTITSFTPTTATAGTSITITGTNFSTTLANDRLVFNQTQQFASSASSTSIATTVPAAMASGHISVSTPGGMATSSQDLYIPFGTHAVGDISYTNRTTLGSTVTVSISTANKIGLLLFDAVAGQKLFLGLSSSTFSSCNLYIIAPNGVQLTSSGCSSSSSTYVDTTTLPTSGTYTIGIEPGSSTGSVGITLDNPTDITGTITPNGAAMSETTTVPGQDVRLTFSGTTGQQVRVQASDGSGYSGTINLVAPNGSVVTYFTLGVNSSGYTSLQTLATTGTYTIWAQHYVNYTGSVTLQLYSYGTPPSRPSGETLDSSNALSTNLVGLFLMNEGTGTTDTNLVDSATAAFSGTSTPTWNTTDPSIAFGGGSSLNSYLNAGTDLNFDQLPTHQITIVTEVYVSGLSASGICEKNDGNSIDSGFTFGWTSSGALELMVEKSSVDMQVESISNVVPSGAWVQLAFTWDGTVGTAAAAHLFVNGQEQTKYTSVNGGGTIGYANATSQPFRIGNASFDYQIAGSLNGKMAYLAVYRGRILTTTEMQQLHAQLPIH